MKWKTNWFRFIQDLQGMPSEIDCNEVSGAATNDQLHVIEKEIKISLPPKFRKFLLENSAGIDIWWCFKDDALVKLKNERESINSGGFSLNINEFPDMNEQFEDGFEPDEYDLEFRPENLLSIASTPNGDMFAVVLDGPDTDKIKYLSHDIDDIHLYVAGNDFESFLENYARIGFAGPEYWIWEQFTNQRTTPIDCESPPAVEFIDAVRKGRRSPEAEAVYQRASEAMRKMQYEKYVLPEAEQLVQQKDFDAFITLLSGYSDLLSGAVKKRYEYYLKKNND